MDAMRMADVVARVVTWHNRHPLARRIAPDDVGTVGLLALPYAAAEPMTPGAPTRALFGSDWMYRPHQAWAGRLATWVRAHGVDDAAPFAGWPRRQIDAELPLSHAADADGLSGRILRHVLSTSIDGGGQRLRVLVAPRAGRRGAAVFGPRQWSVPRLSAAAGALAASLVAIVAAAMPAGAPPSAVAPTVVTAIPEGPVEPAEPASAPTLAAVAVATRVATSAAVAEPASSATTTITATTTDTTMTVSEAPSPLPPASAPAPPRARARAVDLRPPLSEAERLAARQISERARAARAARPPTGTATASVSTPPASGPVHGVAAPDDAVVSIDTTRRIYAIATRPLPQRDDAEAQQAILRGLVVTQPTPYATQLELMQAQGRWRAVWWPHPDRDLAEGLLLLARQRGLRVELVAF